MTVGPNIKLNNLMSQPRKVNGDWWLNRREGAWYEQSKSSDKMMCRSKSAVGKLSESITHMHQHAHCFCTDVLNKLKVATTDPSNCVKQFFPTQCFHLPLHHWSVYWHCKLISQIFLPMYGGRRCVLRPSTYTCRMHLLTDLNCMLQNWVDTTTASACHYAVKCHSPKMLFVW